MRSAPPLLNSIVRINLAGADPLGRERAGLTEAGLAGFFHGALGECGALSEAPNPDCGFHSSLFASLVPDTHNVQSGFVEAEEGTQLSFIPEDIYEGTRD